MVGCWLVAGTYSNLCYSNPMLAVSLSLGSPSGFGSRGLEHAVAADAPPSSDPTNSSCNTQAGRDGSARLLMVTSGNFLVPLVIIQKSSSWSKMKKKRRGSSTPCMVPCDLPQHHLLSIPWNIHIQICMYNIYIYIHGTYIIYICYL